MRVGVALVFWRSGQSKLPLGNEPTIGLFRDIYQVPLLPPELAAYLATMIEIACPVLLPDTLMETVSPESRRCLRRIFFLARHSRNLRRRP